MDESVQKRLDYLNAKKYRDFREKANYQPILQGKKEPFSAYNARCFADIVANEVPVFYGEDDFFGFNLHYVNSPYKSNHFGNVVIDFATVLKDGLNGYIGRINAKNPTADKRAKEFYGSALTCLNALKSLVAKWREKAENDGRTRIFNILSNVPENGAKNYEEATVTLKFMEYALHLGGYQHITLGRFDKYMKPYYDISVRNGESREELLKQTELFFISLNFDSDLYSVVQTGDNGQSLVLVGRYGSLGEVFSELSETVLQASENLRLIDPKINIRVNKNTPLALYERGTKLTKQGLGFPQYCNDDVVIRGLKKLGYAEKDAEDYAVAACWEFITSGCGADIPNIGTFSFPLAVETATDKYLKRARTFDVFMEKVQKSVKKQAKSLIKDKGKHKYGAKPLLSVFVNDCIARGRDLSEGGARYNNFGLHGAGISTATDALGEIKTKVFEEKSVSKEDMLLALKNNFEGYEALRKNLINDPKKLGNNEPVTNGISESLLKWFADDVNGKPNRMGGVFRAGTGSAQEYVFSGKMVGATADGRKAAEPFACSFSPSLIAKIDGPLSAVQSFVHFPLEDTVNGGPFTIEIHDTVFRNEEGERKVAMLIKSFFDMGGHQMQINAINRERLLDAQKHPERYPNLIVRVWGWSGYFNELDKVFQDHIIARCEYSV